MSAAWPLSPARPPPHDSSTRVAPEIRAMCAADVPGVVAVERSAYEFPWSKRLFRDCLRVGYGCFVLGDSSRIGAHAIMQVAAGEAHLLNLCVARDVQGRGYGRAMLDFLLEQARRQTALRLFLEVRPSNAAARALYLAAGFNQVGRRPRYYPARDGREDALVLSIDLRRRNSAGPSVAAKKTPPAAGFKGLTKRRGGI